MIAPYFIDVPCTCGRPHHIPLSEDGVQQFICLSRRTVLTLRVGNLQRLHAALQRGPSADEVVRTEGVCVVHKAAAPRDDQQRCEHCGWLLVSYRSFLLRFGEARRRVLFWPAGSLVGRTRTGDYYLAREPLSVHRERRCFTRVAL